MDASVRRSFFTQLVQVMRAAVRAWLTHRAARKGAALAYYTLFSIAPILVLLIAIAGALYGADAAQGRLMAELQGLRGHQGAEFARQYALQLGSLSGRARARGAPARLTRIH